MKSEKYYDQLEKLKKKQKKLDKKILEAERNCEELVRNIREYNQRIEFLKNTQAEYDILISQLKILREGLTKNEQ